MTPAVRPALLPAGIAAAVGLVLLAMLLLSVPGANAQTDPQTVNITAENGSEFDPIVEGRQAKFTVTRSGTLTAGLTVNVSVSQVGSYLTGSSPTTVTFTGTNITGNLNVSTQTDSTHEDDGSVTVTLDSGTGYTVGEDDSATVFMKDNDNSPARGAPTISGQPWVGQTQTASTSGISDADGLNNASYRHEWRRVDSSNNETKISPTSTSVSASNYMKFSGIYIVREADRGSTIKVKVSFNDDEDDPRTANESRTSAATAMVADPPVGSSLPYIDLTIGNQKGWAIEGGAAKYPSIEVSSAFDVTITFSEPVSGFDIHDVKVAYPSSGSVGLTSLTEVTAGTVYEGVVDRLVEGSLFIEVEPYGGLPIIAEDDGRQAAATRTESGVDDVNTAILNLNVVAPPPPGPSSAPAVWSATMTVGESGGYEGYVVSGSSLLPDGTGSVSDTMFTLEGTEYTVEEVLLNPAFGRLYLRVSETLPNDGSGMTLNVGDQGFSLGDASDRGNGLYSWMPFVPDWSAGDTVAVSLRRLGGL